MTSSSQSAIVEHANDLVLIRRIPASAQTLFRCWTEPELIKQWFVPSPWTIAHVQLDLRAGGQSLIVMQDPEGNQHPNPGVYLEVIPNRRLVFTDAYTAGWLPAAKPFMTAIISFEPEGEQTLYTARARHWSAEARQQHLDMGFEQGWGICADQLQTLAARIA
ncbi:SRPBCC family protein [Comamonas aquatilis]|uniref:SRPBCC family protein n=1 Tax=Comamonas aquatilis TaxID=1778406 RepID=UPI0039F0F589